MRAARIATDDALTWPEAVVAAARGPARVGGPAEDSPTSSGDLAELRAPDVVVRTATGHRYCYLWSSVSPGRVPPAP